MKNRKKTIIYTILLSVLIIGVSYIYAHIDKNTYIYERNADTGTYFGTGILAHGEEVSQQFVARENSIDGINIKVSLAGNVADVVMHYAIIDQETGETYAASVDAVDLENNKFNQLPVERIEGTRGKTYTLVLYTENSDELNGVSFYGVQSAGEDQQFIIKENAVEGNLVTRIISHKFDVETFIVFMAIVVFIITFMKVLYKSFK